MASIRRRTWTWIIVALCMVSAGQALAQPGPPFGRGRRGPGGPGQDPQFVADRDVFHFLLGNHDQVRRKVTPRADGVETLTESDNPEIAAKIQEHVAAMYRRVEEGHPIHLRDPLFAEVFRHADLIELKFEKTEKGAKVVETSKDPYVAKLIQAHADVVNLFVKNGFNEPPKNHAVPTAATAAKPADEPLVAAGPCGKCPACCAQQANAACKACPKAAASNPACQACPNAANCPGGASCPQAKAADDAPPPPNQGVKAKPGNAKSKGKPKS